MEKLSGLVIDAYDDSDGTVLRELFPETIDLAELEKNAHALTPEEHNALPDDAFALVLMNGGCEMRKFATIDAGNTALSVMYFMKTAHRLPEEAQKVAANNLVASCEMYGLEAPELLQKIAFGAMGLLNAALVVPGQARKAQQNLAATKGTQGVVLTPQQIQQRKAQMGMY